MACFPPEEVDRFIRKRLQPLQAVFPQVFPILVTHMVSRMWKTMPSNREWHCTILMIFREYPAVLFITAAQRLYEKGYRQRKNQGSSHSA